MASNKKEQKKRKSAGLGDIFEVSDKDLSPEPEECDSEEPKAKILKTRDSDVAESRKNNEQHNLDAQVQNTNISEKITEKHDKSADSGQKIETSNSLVFRNDEVHLVDDSDEELNKEPVSKCTATSKTENIDTTISSSNNSNDEKQICEPTLSKIEDNIPSGNQLDVFTIPDEDGGSNEDDVIMICDSSIDMSREVDTLSSPQVIHDNTLEDAEVKENTAEEPDTSEVTINPSISIKFSDKSTADLYRPKLLQFLQSFVELEVKNVSDTTLDVFKDVLLDPNEWVVLDDTVCSIDNNQEVEEDLAKLLPVTPKPENLKKKKKKKKQPKTQPEEELFVVDINPGGGHKPLVAKYSAKFSIDDEKHKEEKKDISKPSFGSVCFNCDKEHSLKDCPHPRNYGKINANRQKFQSKNKSSRYHLEEDQKYSHLLPGKISPDLRKALGLRKNQIPSYVYQMRVLGYPPGWLEEAKFVASELSMFGLDGKNVKNTTSKIAKGLDPDKVIDYPGFNVAFAKDCKDEYKYYRVPPFCDSFSKQNMIEVFNKICQRQEDDMEAQDMDLDNTNETLGEDIMIVDDSSELQVKQLDSSIDYDSNNDVSLSLQDLQKQKDSLLKEIKKSGEAIPWDQSAEDTSQSSAGEVRTEEQPERECSKTTGDTTEKELSEGEIVEEEDETTGSKNKETRLEINISEVSEMNESSFSPNVSNNVNCVKHSVFGTPILKSASPYNRLPNPDNFTKGVSPVIDFENLPNSTGKYEQMTGVIQKVRDTLKNLNKSKT